MNDLLILLALSWFVRKWFAGATLANFEDFLIYEEVGGEEVGER